MKKIIFTLILVSIVLAGVSCIAASPDVDVSADNVSADNFDFNTVFTDDNANEIEYNSIETIVPQPDPTWTYDDYVDWNRTGSEVDPIGIETISIDLDCAGSELEPIWIEANLVDWNYTGPEPYPIWIEPFINRHSCPDSFYQNNVTSADLKERIFNNHNSGVILDDNDNFVMSAKYNSGTGYHWVVSDESYGVTVSSDEYVLDHPGAMGSSGTVYFNFHVDNPENYYVKLVLISPSGEIVKSLDSDMLN